MSNRLDNTFRIPLIPDPDLALRAGMAFTLSRAHAERVISFGRATAESFSVFGEVLEDLGRAIEQARRAQTLSALSDKELARRGLSRSGIPAAVWKIAPSIPAA